jgi:WD40 repeat protein
MRRLVLLLAIAAVLGPGSARSAGCSPLNCAPSQFTVDGGTLLAVRGSADGTVRVLDLRTGATRWRLPGGIVAGDTLVHRDGRLVTWFDVARGTRLRDATLEAHGAFGLVGLSQGGEWAVLQRVQTRSTTFVLLSPSAAHTVVLAGNNWSFDALRGDKLYLIEQLERGYEVRLFDLASNRLQARPLKDPDGSSIIWGSPFARLASPTGQFVFTLYIGGDGGVMVHILDLGRATARCVDLPGDGDYSAATTYALAVSNDGRTLWAVSPGYGRVVTIDVAAHRVVDAFRFDSGRWTGYAAGMAALAPGGTRIAVTDAEHIWLVDPAQHNVARPIAHVALGLGFSPDGKTLWAVGERSRVTAVKP